MQVVDLNNNEYDLIFHKSKGEEMMRCPSCSDSRKKKHLKCFGWNHDIQKGRCNHCEIILFPKPSRKSKEDYKIPEINNTQLSDKSVKWLNDRGISKSTIKRFNLSEGLEWMPQENREMNTIQFNYFRDGKLVNVKYRDAKKNFKMTKDAELILYNIDGIKDHESMIICEGEIDALTVYEACGFINVVSVPNGGTTKNDFFNNCYDQIKNMKEIIICVDNDEVGINLRRQISERFGKYRCSYVDYPKDCKDINDVLVNYGRQKVKECIDNKKYFPVDGIFTMSDYAEDLYGIWKNGVFPGFEVSCIGFRINYGRFTVVTGVPHNGKSELVDQIIVEMTQKHSWKWGILSFENYPYTIHQRKIANKILKKPFNELSSDELMSAMGTMQDSFIWLDFNSKEMTIDVILGKVKELMLRYGINGFLIDPWNFIETNGNDDTDSIKKILVKMQKFIRETGIHIILIAHTTKIQGDREPTLYDISGSAHFFNIMDNGVIVHRENSSNQLDDKLGDTTKVIFPKVRFDEDGSRGYRKLDYNKRERWFYKNEINYEHAPY